MAVGSSTTLTLQVNVSGLALGTLTNFISLVHNTADPFVSNNSDTEETVVFSQADLVLSKQGSPDPVSAGSQLEYLLTVSNAGPNFASSVVVTDPLPAGVTFNAAASSPECAFGGGTVTCAVASIANNAANVFTVRVGVASSLLATSLTNAAAVTSVTPDPVATNNVASAQTLVNNFADLRVTKSDSPDPVVAGNGLTYIIYVTNSGPSDAVSVTVTDVLPSAVSPSGIYVTNLGTMVVGATASITLNVQVASSAGIAGLSNSVFVSSLTPDPDTGNNSVSELTETVTASDCGLTKSDSPDPVLAGNILTYTFVVTNSGPSDAPSAFITDVLPAGVTPSGTYVTNLGAIAAGSTKTVTLNVTVNSSALGVLTNRAWVSHGTADDVSGNNTSIVETVVNSQANLGISMSDTPDPVLAGQALTYTITITNAGPSDALNVQTVDTLPLAAYPSGQLTNAIDSLAAGSVTSFTINVTVSSSALGVITNVATVSSTTQDPNPGNNTTSQPTVVNASVDLRVVKTDTPDPVIAGSNLAYTITYSNAGPSDATGITISDTMPSGLTFVVPPSSNLVAYYPFAVPANPSSVHDFSGNNHTGTIFGGTYVANGQVQNGLSMSGPGSDSRVEIPDAADLRFTNNEPITITLWFRPPTTFPGVEEFLSKGRTAGIANPNYSVRVLAGGQLDFLYMNNSTSTFQVYRSTGAAFPTIGVWYHVAVTYTFGSAASIQMYVNGAVVPSSWVSGSGNQPPVATTDPLWLGAERYDTNSAAQSEITAILDEVRIYRRILAPAEVSLLAGGTLPQSSEGWTLAGNTPEYHPGTLAPGASTSVTIVAHVSPSTVGVITNLASINSAVTETSSADNTNVAMTTVNGSADLRITKSDTPDPVTAGQALAYTITVTNLGPSDAASCIVTDVLPAAVSPGGIYVTNLGALAVGSSASFTLNVTVASSAFGTITNVATVSSATADPNAANNSTLQPTVVNSSADLRITKTDSPDPATAGAGLAYTITVSNAGPSDAISCVVTDTLPGSVTPTGVATNNLGTIVSGASTSFVINVMVNSFSLSVISNSATVASGTADPNTTNNTASQLTVINFLADLRIAKSDSPDPVIAGMPLVYTVAVSNAGPSHAFSVVVTDAFPSAVSPGGLLTTNFGDMAAGTVKSFSVTVTVNSAASGVITNIAGVSSGTTDTNLANNSAAQLTTVNAEADLSIRKTDSSDPVTAGTALSYTMTVSNAGPSVATGVQINDNRPVGATPNGLMVTNVGSINPGSTTSATISVTVNSSKLGVLTNLAFVSAATTDSNTGNNSATELTTVNSSADLLIVKTDSPDPVVASSNLVYTITVTNLGPSDALSCIVTDALPAGVTPTGNYVSNLATIVAGSAKTFAVTVSVNAATVGAITNVATVISATSDPASGNNSTSQPTVVNAVADLGIGKSDAPDPITTNSALAYTIFVTNFGPSVATAVTVTDTLPSGVTPSGVVVSNLGALSVGSSTSFIVNVSVNGSTVGAITNSAAVTSAATDPNAANNTATVTTAILDFDNDGQPDFGDADDDNDGIPDFWEILYGLNPLNPADAVLDPDIDKFNNYQEYIADTVPTNVNSFHHIQFISNALSRIVTFPSSTGRVYDLQFNGNLLNVTNWLDLLTNVPGAAGTTSVTDTNSATRSNYRIKVKLP